MVHLGFHALYSHTCLGNFQKIHNFWKLFLWQNTVYSLFGSVWNATSLFASVLRSSFVYIDGQIHSYWWFKALWGSVCYSHICSPFMVQCDWILNLGVTCTLCITLWIRPKNVHFTQRYLSRSISEKLIIFQWLINFFLSRILKQWWSGLSLLKVYLLGVKLGPVLTNTKPLFCCITGNRWLCKLVVPSAILWRRI